MTLNKQKPRKTVWCYPRVNKTNQYISVNAEVLTLAGYQIKFTDLLLSSVVKEFFGKQREVLILNWFEDRVTYSSKPLFEFIKSLFLLLFIKIKFSKVIWVRHNFKPHTKQGQSQYNMLCWLLNKISKTTITHRPVNCINSTYIPHPLYKKNIPNSSLVKDIHYLYFGVIKKYKGLETLLAYWPKDKPLTIAGKCNSQELLNSLNHLIESRRLDCNIINSFITDDVLDNYINRAHYIILPHTDNSMIVSGSLYHALSLGANVIMTKSDFSKYAQNTYKTINIVDMESINNLDGFQEKPVDTIISSAKLISGHEVIAEKWKKAIEISTQ